MIYILESESVLIMCCFEQALGERANTSMFNQDLRACGVSEWVDGRPMSTVAGQ